ncbi:MAG TPA: guanitoxin biosynthesis L-enduracididine beta-hydroxylase GntD, partial [Thermoanaerobaculia bacterium]|nr:guanitoxin biosynthesis L-enduracididine beta-hydroxylase GntD [Thermoanaerobaculia bacterium]
MHKIVLTDSEVEQIRALLDGLAGLFESVEDDDFLRQAAILAHELPRRLRVHLNDFRLLEPTSAICLISGYPVDEERIGPTPPHWKNRVKPSPTLREEMLFVLCASLLGEAIGWSTQQDGHIVHDLCPIQEHEKEQIGTGSEQDIWWHTEDAFHPLRGDYIGMMCLRNPDRVPTTFANLEGLGLTEEEREQLSRPVFPIRPDNSHRLVNKVNGDGDPALLAAYQEIERMNTEPLRIAVLEGDLRTPYIRLDPYFMEPAEDLDARRAFERLTQLLDARLGEVLLEPGDIGFFDNFQSVHGRRAFKARYDGTDRWMKRLNVTRDLRRSRA